MLTNYLGNKLLDHVLRNTAYTQPTTVYLALFKADPTVAGTLTNEVSTTVDDTAYARQAVTVSAASSKSTSNSVAATFPAVVYGSGAASYNVTHVALMDGGTAGAGNMLEFIALGATESMTTGKSLSFPIGALTFSLT